MTQFLVTGGAGFIGSSIVRELLERGAKVRVLDNLSTGKMENLESILSQIDFREGDLRNPDDVASAVDGVTYVTHQAALASVPRSIADPHSTNDVNVSGTLRLLDASAKAGVQRVVFASSSSVYGETEVLPKREDMPTDPLSPYAASKATGELYCRVYAHTFGLETVALRYFNVFGPRQDPNSQYAAVIPRFITRLLSGEPPVVYGDGGQSRDFCFIDNVVQANLKACVAAEASGRVFNVALGTRITLLQLLEHLRELTGVDIAAVHEEARAGDVRHSMADIAPAQEVLGYTPSVAVADGLARTVDWYRNA